MANCPGVWTTLLVVWMLGVVLGTHWGRKDMLRGLDQWTSYVSTIVAGATLAGTVYVLAKVVLWLE